MAAHWCKVASNLDSHPKIRKAGNYGRQVYEFVLRRNAELDLGGRIPASHLEPWYLADVLMLEMSHAETGLSRSVTAGLLVPDGEFFAICGWDDTWSKRPLSNSERKRNQRVRERDSTTVTDSHDANVTAVTGHACHGSEEIRVEYKSPPLETFKDKVDRAKRSPRAPTKTSIPSDWEPTDKHREKAKALGLDCAAQADKFRDRNIAHGGRYADWDAAFSYWLRNSRSFAGSEKPAPKKMVLGSTEDTMPPLGDLDDEDKS